MGSPFFDGLALRVSDGNAYLPQDLLVDLADRRSQRPNGGRGIEIKNRHEIFMGEIVFRFHPASGHQGVGNADGGGCLKLHFDVIFIIFLQEGTVNDIEEVLPVFLPILICQLMGNIRELLGQIIAADPVALLQHSRYGIHVPFFQGPQPGGAGMFTGPCVGNIKHIPQAGPVPGIVHQGNAFGAAPHIAPHFLIPQVVLRAGGSVRALGVNHQLLMERVFVKTGGGGKKSRPFLPAAGELPCRMVRHLRVHFCFGWHGFLSSLQN